MKMTAMLVFLLTAVSCPLAAYGASGKVRVLVVSSYHREYLWSQETNAGLTDAMLRFGYLDNRRQVQEFTKNDYIESSRAIVQKEWMDTKRRYGNREIAQATKRIMDVVKNFKPTIVFLGDDNAANYIGNQLLDTPTPAIFWGINGLPIKYGLLERMDEPGHNITGVWQSGYLRESLEFLHKLVPTARTFAILACDSATSRPKIKQLHALARDRKLPMELVDTVATNSFEVFKRRALELSKKVDAFFVLNHDTLKDDQGNHVSMMAVGKWYLENIRKPETSHEGQFVKEGMLSAANDSGYNQGYEAFEMAIVILERGYKPANIRPKTPQRGPLMVNRQRAKMLGISLDDRRGIIEQVIEEALALRK